MKNLLTIAALLTGMAAEAQTLNVSIGSVTYQFPATQTGEMNFQGGSSLTVMGKTFELSDVTRIYTDDTSVTDNLVSVAYSGTEASVTVAGNAAQYVNATVSGAHVSIEQLNTDAVDGDEITYQLSGTSTDGSLTLDGTYKCTIALNGLTLTNPSGAAININNKKRIQLSAKKGTENTLTDGADGSQKACIYSKGQLQLQGNGSLTVAGKTKHGIKSASYVSIKNLTLNITSTVGDGISCEEYLLMESGTVTLSGIGDDGLQCDLGGETSTGQTTDHEDEDSGNIYIEGGTLSISTSAAATKGIKADGDVSVSGGDISVRCTGSAAWDSDDSEVKGSTCVSSDGNMTISGGTMTLTNSGAGGKGMKTDGTMTISGEANVSVTSSGQIAYCSSTSNTTIRTTTSSSTTERLNDALKTSPKGIKADGTMTISGGTVNVSATYHEGIECKSTLDISGGYVYAYSSDDAINSSSHMTISGGYIMANSSGNDGIDANGNLTITGGNVFAVAARQPEVGLDANTEGGYKLYISGGNVVAIGGFESGASISGGTAKSASYSKGSWYGLYNGSALAFAFKVPSNSSMGTSMAVYTTSSPALKSNVTGSGTSFWSGNGYSGASGGSSVSLSNYSSGGGHGPGGGGRPGNW